MSARTFKQDLNLNDPHICFLGLGSNLNRPALRLKRAIKHISLIPTCKLLATSSAYTSEAIGPGAQGQYLNAVVCIRVMLPPWLLLRHTQGIEKTQQRKKRARWGPRTIDIDILLLGNTQLQSRKLIIPHPRLLERNFVVQPLLEIAPNLILPNGQLLSQSHLGRSHHNGKGKILQPTKHKLVKAPLS